MRTTNAVARNQSRKKILAYTKGFRGTRKNCKRIAKQAMRKSLKYSYIGRKLQTRNVRTLAIQRINAYARTQNLTYSKIIGKIIEKGFTRQTFTHLLGFIELNHLEFPTFESLLNNGC